ncbi:MAG: PEP-CTERM sorting domain-containing protein [Phycisphaerae bacterium]
MFAQASTPPGRARVAVIAMCAAVGLMLAPASAMAGTYTAFNPPSLPEPPQEDILGTIYGGTFVPSGVDFTNGAITARRVFDQTVPNLPIDIITGTPTDADQIWTDGTAEITAQAMFALFPQSFGWNGGGLGTTYTELLTDADIGGAPVNLMVTGDFLWGINPGSPDMWWSLESNNSDNADHLLTYQIDGLGVSETVWLLFWEDQPFGASDLDYNDFVIELRAIPEPATLLLLSLGGLLVARRRR